MTLRAAFVSTVSRLMDEDESVVLLLGDISVWAFRETFAKHPKRCYNIGICEQGSVGVAAGLAMSGLYPVFHTIDSFMVRRAYEQIYLDFGVQNLAGMFVSVGGSREYSKLGPTHMCPEAPTLMNGIPNMSWCIPQSEIAVEHRINDYARSRTLSYIRLEELPT